MTRAAKHLGLWCAAFAASVAITQSCALAADPPRVATKVPSNSVTPQVDTNQAMPTNASGEDGYCRAIWKLAASDLAAREKADVQRLATEVEERTVELERRIASIKEWVAKRDAFLAKAQDGLVQIYAKMLPEAAATHLAAMAEETAAAVLMRLEPKQASALMAEMDVAKAARLAAVLSAAGELTSGAKSEPLRRDAKGPPERKR